MLLTITTDHRPATDLGYLLHKHPDRFQSFDLKFGDAHVGYPTAGDDRCTAALAVEVDPVRLARRRSAGGRTLYDHVNDRPYVASSFLSVAINKVFGSALRGRCDARPDLVHADLPLVAEVAVVPCRDGEPFVRELFEPLGYDVEVERFALDPELPDWGDADLYVVHLAGHLPLRSLLEHLYVLLPVMDDAKHYWVDADEIDKLLRYGGDWLADHPRRDAITHRYLKRRGHLSRSALERLEEDAGVGTDDDAESIDAAAGAIGAATQPSPRLRQLRLDAVEQALRSSGAATVADLGCGEGALLQRLVPDQRFTRLVGADVSVHALRRAKERLKLDRLAPHQQQRVELIQSSVVYADERLHDLDAVALVEVVEHLDPWRLPALELTVFRAARPGTVVVTTPNAEHNVRFTGLPAGTFRHPDHRFEWTRDEFAVWAQRVADEHGYDVRFEPIGDDDPEVGPPTQMAVFRRIDGEGVGGHGDRAAGDGTTSDGTADDGATGEVAP